MRTLSNTLQRLAALGNRPDCGQTPVGSDRLVDLAGFGSDPGRLRARCYVPAGMARGAALVVVLHGCTQTAAGYDLGSGWSRLADRHGFALLYPEQQRANNPNLCFNWFSPKDTRRDGGEALSIRQMVAQMVADHAIDPARIFVTGLSAGGAMTSVMLATYPELFAGGAIIAGLPYGTAASVSQAFDRMRGHGGPGASGLAALVRGASAHTGPWPTVSIWHGSGDATVSPANAGRIVDQWRDLHGVAEAPSRQEVVDGHPRRVWNDGTRDVIEEYSIAGLGHGTPLATGGAEGCGVPGAYMLEAGISSTRRIAHFWGLLDETIAVAPTEDQSAPQPPREPVATLPAEPVTRLHPLPGEEAAPAPAAAGVGKVIEDALRAAGLMR